MKLFYGERLGDQSKGEAYIAEQGVFTSIEEFIPYRLKGWTAAKKNNELADAAILAAAEAAKGKK